jgi:hypothetical protein
METRPSDEQQNNKDKEKPSVSNFTGSENWNGVLKAVNIPTDWMNGLVMNYLTTQGYSRAAEQLHAETGTPMGCAVEGTRVRMKVRRAIEDGQPDGAIDQVVDLNPEILEDRPDLLFRLKKQQFIELVSQGKSEDALEFAEQELAGRVDDDPALLQELESAMALLLFPDPFNNPLSYMLEPSYRKETADALNSAILSSETKDSTCRLPRLLSIMAWCQKECQKVSSNTCPVFDPIRARATLQFPDMVQDAMLVDESGSDGIYIAGEPADY